ncbi:2,3-diaminopropionate biosynthesis protein SbnB [Paraburkholderia sp. IW21]|uniref:2,3-diaminopropionate biosynthesis protein SbnB n=1 Tax=Paraburkholderia sp. IW21 TaxID=3242488 RepID=UPI003520F1E8
MNYAISASPEFRVITGKQVGHVVYNNRREVIDVIEDAYRRHFDRATVNPDSYFLKFPEAPSDRIIALPAHIQAKGESTTAITGIKWISSFPGNLALGIPRAAAVLILNDSATGYPTACMEASIISAARTAASAASMARLILGQRGTQAIRLSIVGAGLISRYVVDFLGACSIEIKGVRVYDLNNDYSSETVARLERCGLPDVLVSDCLEEAIRYGEIVLFGTTAATPHVRSVDWFSHNPLVLHLSLRDLSPEVILSSYNIVDDIEHCMKAQTSLHLTETATGSRDFVTTSLPEMLSTGCSIPQDRTVIFSPFGMGILDLALGQHVLSASKSSFAPVENFFFDLARI